MRGGEEGGLLAVHPHSLPSPALYRPKGFHGAVGPDVVGGTEGVTYLLLLAQNSFSYRNHANGYSLLHTTKASLATTRRKEWKEGNRRKPSPAIEHCKSIQRGSVP